MENDGPYQAKGQLRVAIDDILGADVDQFDLFGESGERGSKKYREGENQNKKKMESCSQHK